MAGKSPVVASEGQQAALRTPAVSRIAGRRIGQEPYC